MRLSIGEPGLDGVIGIPLRDEFFTKCEVFRTRGARRLIDQRQVFDIMQAKLFLRIPQHGPVREPNRISSSVNCDALHPHERQGDGQKKSRQHYRAKTFYKIASLKIENTGASGNATQYKKHKSHGRVEELNLQAIGCVFFNMKWL